MSISNFLERLRQRILTRRVLPKPRATGKLRVTRLEERRLLDAAASLVGGALTLDSFDAIDQLVISDSPTDGALDFTLASGNWVPVSGSGLTAVDKVLTVDAATASTLTSLRIDASDNPTTSINASADLEISAVEIVGGGDISFNAAANDFDTFSASGTSLSLRDLNAVELGNLSLSSDLAVVASDVTNTSGSIIDVLGDADFAVDSVQIDNAGGSTVDFGSVQFTSIGDVTITENSAMHVSGSSSGSDVNLTAEGTLTAATGATVAGTNVTLTANESTTDVADIGTSTDPFAIDTDSLTTFSNGDQHLTATGSIATGDLTSNDNVATPLGVDAADGPGTITFYATDFNISESQVDVNGMVSLNGSLSLTPGVTPTANDTFTIIDNDAGDAMSGSLGGLAEGDVFVTGGEAFQISYAGGDGNDVVLTSAKHAYDFSAANYDGAESGNITATLNRTGNTSIASTVEVVVGLASGAKAAESSDFTAKTVIVSFDAGDTSATIDVAIADDTIVEDDELIALSLQNFSSGGSAGTTNASSTITVANDDTATLTISNITATETNANQNLTATVTLNAAVEGGLDVAYSSALVTAEATDLSVTGSSLTFDGAAGEQETISVTVIGDAIVEDDETFTITLGDVSGTTAVQDLAITTGAVSAGVINNDDTATLSIDDVSVNENAGTATFTVNSSNASESALAVTVGLNHVTTSSGDLSLVTSTATIAGDGSETSTAITVSIADDLRVEGVETYTVNLSSATYNAGSDVSRVTIGDGIGAGTVNDNDTATISFDATTANLDEDDAGTAVSISLDITAVGSVGTAGLDSTIDVEVNQTGGTASGSAPQPDYTFANSTMSFGSADGDGTSFTKTVSLNVHEDIVDDDSETIVLSLQNLTDGSGGQAAIGTDSTHTVTINDDDTATAANFDVSGSGANVVVEVNAGVLEIFVGGTLAASRDVDNIQDLIINGTSGADVFTIDLGSEIAADIVVNGGDAADTLTIINPTGAIPTSGTVTFNGDAGDDALEVLEGTANEVEHRFTNNSDGTVHYNGGLASITYTGLAPVLDTVTATTRTFSFTGAAETITLSDDGTVANNMSFIDSTLGESVTFLNPSAILTIETETNGGSGADTLNIEGVDSSWAATDLIVTAGNNDTVNFQTMATNLGSGDLSVAANEINVSTAISTTGGAIFTNSDDLTITAAGDATTGASFTQNGPGNVSTAGDITTNGGSITFAQAVTLTGDVVLDTTNAGATLSGGDVSFQTISGASNSLSVNGGTAGHLVFGGTVTAVDQLTVTNAEDAVFKDSVAVTSLTIADMQAATTFEGTVNATTVTLTDGNKFEFQDSLVATSLNAAAGAYEVGILQGATITNAVTFNNTGGVTIGDESTDVATFSNGLTSTASDTSLAGTLQSADSDISLGELTLTADSVVDSTGAAAGDVILSSTVATAGNNFTLDGGTAGNVTASGTISGGGNLVVRDSNELGMAAVSVASIDILDATTSVAFNDTVVVTANNATGGKALKVNSPGIINIDGSITATAAASLNIDIDPTDVNVNSDLTATGDVDIVATNNITVAAGVTIQADSDSSGAGDLSITADSDTNGAGNIFAAADSVLGGFGILLAGQNVTTGIVSAGDDLTVGAVDSINLTALTTVAGNLSLTTTGNTVAAAIVDSGSGSLNVTGTTSLTAFKDITLNNVANDFIGSVSLVDVGTATLVDVNNITMGNVTGTTNLNVDATSIVFNGNVALAGNLDADASTGGISQASALDIDGSTTLKAATDIVLTNAANDFTGDVTVTASQNTQLTDVNAISLDQITATDAVTISAGGNITDGNATANNITANVLNANAAGSISLDTNIDFLNASTTAAGDIEIDEADAITLTDVDTSNGSITINAQGTITATDVDSVGGSVTLQTTIGGIGANDIASATSATLTADAGDITVGAVTAGTSATITATTGSINDISADPDIVTDITAAAVTLVAANGIGNTAHIDLSSQTISAQTTNNGDIRLNNDSAADVSVTNLNAGTGNVTFNQTGTASITLSTVTATNFELCIDAGDILLTNNIATTDVRLQTASGEIRQTGGTITATNLGARAGSGGISLDSTTNNVTTFAALTTGPMVFAEADGFSVGVVTGDACFTATTGITTADSDVLVTSGGGISLTAAVNVGTGTVHIAANRDISQAAAGTITAAELAVRQESAVAGDILLGDANAVNEFAAFNAFASGQIVFNNTLATTIGGVAEFMDADGNAFVATTGVVSTNGNVLIQSADTLFLDEQVNAGTAEARLIGNGLISQDAEGIITARELGVRQQSAAAGDIQLAFENVVDEFAASNAFDSGSISFRSTRAVTVGTSAASTVDGVAFALTTGVVSTNGDVLIDTDGSLFVDNAINAGTADVRLIGNGNITQDINGSITANTLAVRQDAMTGNIVLCFGNAVDELAAFNTADSDTIDFESTRDLTIGAGTAQTIDNITFAATTGVTSSDGDIFIDTVGTLSVEQVINAGTADVRMVGLGNITQTADGIITANALGVRNESGLAGNITLDQANNVDVFAASNSFGDVAFRSTRDLTIGELISFTDSCGNIFGTTTGIRTFGEDVLVQSDRSLFLDEAINAGSGDARLIGTGNISQDAEGIITANSLGVRQTGTTGGIDLDDANNNVTTFAAESVSGKIAFFETNGFSVGSVAGLALFPMVEGVTTTAAATSGADHIILRSTGSITIDQAVTNNDGGNVLVSAETGNNDVTANANVSSTGGHVTLMATADISLTAGVTVSTTGTGTLHVDAGTGGFTMATDATLQTADGDIHADADANISVGHITTLANVALTSTAGAIVDADTVADPAVDITATGLRLNAQLSVGEAANHLETTVANITAASAASDIFLRETNAITVTTVAVTTQKVAADCNTSAVTDLAQSDLVATAGNIVLTNAAGDITLNDGTTGTGSTDGITVNAGSNVRVAADAGSILGNADVQTAADGDISLTAAINVVTSDDVTTSGSGTILINATSGSVTINDGSDANETGLTTADGDILITAGNDVTLNADISSTSGDVGIDAANNIVQNAADITTGGDVSLEAAAIAMADGTSIDAGTNLIATASTGNISLGLLDATNVSLTATDGSIFDNNGGGTANVRATNFAARAGNSIGADAGNAGSSTNDNAIDTEVTTLAATSPNGIYVQELAAGTTVTVGSVAAVDVAVDANDVANNATSSNVDFDRSQASLEDLTTTANGPIKLVAEAGSITVNAGTVTTDIGISAGGAGDILVDSLTDATNLSTDVQTGTGHITVHADTVLTIEDDIRTTGDGTVHLSASSVTLNDADADNTGITTVDGDILIETTAGDITQNADINATGNGDVGLVAAAAIHQNADVSATGGNVLFNAAAITMASGTSVTADANILAEASTGNLTLGLLEATNVALDATAGNIVDGNGTDTTNVRSTTARFTADGSIGSATGATADDNPTAVDLEVATVAAQSADGIYLQEVAASGNGITVDDIAATTVTIEVQRSTFDSGLATESATDTLSALEDLTTTADGPIKLVAEAGTVTVNNGTGGNGISAGGTGGVLIEARINGNDVIINASVTATTGHITFDADNNVDINAATTTGGTGTLVVLATRNIDSDAALMTDAGDIILNAGTSISQTAAIQSTDGDIGLFAGSDIAQNATGDITTTTGDVLLDAGNDLSQDAATEVRFGGQDAILIAGNNLTLGLLSGTDAATNRIALTAGEDIIDANAGAANVQETISTATTTVSLVATSTIGSGAGTMGSGTNNNAIDLNVDTVAASADDGIYLRELAAGEDIEVNEAAAVFIDIESVLRTNFNNTTTDVSLDRSAAALDDLKTLTDGPIKLVAEDGTIAVNAGTGITAGGSGDVLLEARGTDSDVTVNAAIVSDSGHVTLDADDDISVNAAINTGGTGTLYLLAENATATDAATADGINVDAAITSVDGDILLESLQDIRLNEAVSNTNGDIGLIAARHIEQTNAGDVTTTTGDALIDAGTDWTMAGDAIVSAGGQQVLGTAGGNIILGVISATNADENHIALSANGDITDANAGDINIEETIAAATTTLSLVSGGIIGGVGAGTTTVNDDAIDTNIDTLAASSATGIFVREIAAGGNIEVNTADAVTVDVESVRRSNFDSSITDVGEDRSLTEVEDLTTSDGPIKLVAEAGTITINGGTASAAQGVTAGGTSNVLLEGRTGGDVVVNAAIDSSGGHITINADDDVDINTNVTTTASGTVFVNAVNANAADAVGMEVDGINVNAVITSTAGDVLLTSAQDIRTTELTTSTAGDVGLIASRDIIQEDDGDITTGGDALIEAGNDWTMASNAVITATGGEVDGHALAGDLTLGRINSTNVALTAEGSIIDANGAQLNVDATTLSLRANTGLVGNHDNANNTPATNVNAIDTQVTTLAANAESGIYILEADTLVIDMVNSVIVDVRSPQQVNFNDSTTTANQQRDTAALEDLTTDINGPIKTVTVGTLTINGGTDTAGIAANGTGDVLMQSTATNADIIVNATVASGTGNITFNAADDLAVRAAVTTSDSGSIYLNADNGTSDAVAPLVDGISIDVALATTNGDVLLNSNQDIQLSAAINSSLGDVGLIAGRNIAQQASGNITTDGDLLLEAGNNWTMDSTAVNTASGGEVIGNAIAGDIHLGLISSTNVALTAGNSILDANAGSLNVDATTLSLRALNGAIGTNADAIDTQVATLAANAETGIYILEADDLVVDTVASVTVDINGPVEVNFNSTSTEVPETRTTDSLEDLTTEANGPIKVVATGSLTVDGGTDSLAVSANGSGNILLDANGGDLVVNDNVVSFTGHITLEAANQLNLGASTNTPVTIQTLGSGSIVASVQTADVIMQPNARLATIDGSVHIDAATDVVLGRVFTQANAAITATAGSITDADAGGDFDVDIVADGLLLNSGGTIGEIATNDAIETQVSTVAALSNGEIHISESNMLTVGSVQATTQRVDFGGSTTAVVDAVVNGVDSSGSDILLKTEDSLSIVQQLAAGMADIRIVSGATISQNSDGIITADELGLILRSAAANQNIELGAADNVIGTLAAENTSFEGNITVFDSAGDLVVGQISQQLDFDATAGVDANAGDINITSEGDLTVGEDIDAAHNTPAGSIDESITLISRNGDFILNDNVVVTSDEDPTPGVFDDITGDNVTIIAGSGGSNGIVRLGDDIEVSTDGGVAKQVAPRPTAFAAAPTTGAENAFVTLSDAETMRSNLLFTNGKFLGELELVFGVAGEENLEVVVDWGVGTLKSHGDSDPAGNAVETTPGEFAFDVSDADRSIYYIDKGGATYNLPHLYAPSDLITTADDRNGRQNNPNIIGVRFSVAQHDSIKIWGKNATDPSGTVDSAPPTFTGTAAGIPDAMGDIVVLAGNLALLSSTDPNGLRDFSQEATNQILPFADNRVVTSTGRPEGQAEWEFLAGPSPGIVPAPTFVQQTFDAPLVEVPAIILTATEVPGDINLGSGAAGDSAVGTEVYLQIRRHFESDVEAEVVIPRITDNTFIASRNSFEQFVEENPVLQDGDGYEVWLITETGGQTVARPIVEFEITGGRPGPATEELPDTFEPYELKELEFTQPPEDSIDDEKAAPVENPKSDDDLAATQSPSSEKFANNAAENESVAAASDELQADDGKQNQQLGGEAAILPLLGLGRAARWKRKQQASRTKLSHSSRTIRRMQQHCTDSNDTSQ